MSSVSGGVWWENEAALLQEMKELRYLVGVLLARSGLESDGIARAFELARTETARLDQEMLSVASERFQQTSEGQQVSQQYAAERRQREIAAWREDCLEDGRIYPHPTKPKM